MGKMSTEDESENPTLENGEVVAKKKDEAVDEDKESNSTATTTENVNVTQYDKNVSELKEDGVNHDSLDNSLRVADESINSNLDTSEVITVEDTVDDNVPCKTVPDVVFYDNVSDEEKKYYEEEGPSIESIESLNVQCTACWKQVNHHVMNNIMRHPLLGVAVCRNCRYFYDGDGKEEEWEKDKEGSDLFCRWCAQGGEVLGCDKCSQVFCKRCITRNLGRKRFAEINDSDEWACFTCEPSQIYKERALMYAISRWAADRRLKRRLKEKLKIEKKKNEVQRKNEIEKKKREAARKKQKEEEKVKKMKEEEGKIENFIDENIHEAFDTLNIYQKCLQDEHKKWIRIRKSMNSKNAATAVKSLRKIFAITKQNMELLDTALLQGYSEQFPEETDQNLGFNNASFSSPKKRKSLKTTPSVGSTDNDIEVEEIVVNGEPVLGSMGDSEAIFDPSMLCSVEITAERDSSATPPPKKRKVGGSPPKTKNSNGPLKLSRNMFTKKKKSPVKINKAVVDHEIEEITIIEDDEDSTSYVSQSTLDSIAASNLNQKANKFINSNDDDSFDSDVSLE